MLVQGTEACPAATARAEANFQVLACGRVVAIPRIRVGDDASLPLEVVVAGANHPPGLP